MVCRLDEHTCQRDVVEDGESPTRCLLQSILCVPQLPCPPRLASEKPRCTDAPESGGKLIEANWRPKILLEWSQSESLLKTDGETLNQENQGPNMCSDAGNVENKDFKVKNSDREAECRDLTIEREFHLNGVLDRLISFDEPGTFMDPVDDSFAPNYSKIIKTPMCFSAMREKIYARQYASWRSFVEDFQRICCNAMKYNQKRSKIWNAANTLLRQGKKYLEQQAKSEKILGIFKIMDGDTIQKVGSLVGTKLKGVCEKTPLENSQKERIMRTGSNKDGVESEKIMGIFKEEGNAIYISGSLAQMNSEEACEKIPLESCLKENIMRMGSDKQSVESEAVEANNYTLEEQGPNTFSTENFQDAGGGPILTDFKLSSIKQLDEEQKKVLDGVSSPSSSANPNRSLDEEAIVDILGCVVTEDVRLDSMEQATEYSSSFEGTVNDKGSCAVLDVGEDSGEVESFSRDGNGATVHSNDGFELHNRKKKSLTSEWKTYRRGIEWRCRWLELRVKQLQAHAAGYDEMLNKFRPKTQQKFVEPSSARTIYAIDSCHKKRIQRRRRRRKIEDTVDLSCVMSKHPLFSRYEKRKRQGNEVTLTEEADGEENQQMSSKFADLNRPEDQDIVDFSDGFINGQNSMEELLWDIEVLQMHVMKLKSQLSRALVHKRSSKCSFKDPSLSFPQSSSHLSLLALPRSYGSPIHVQNPNIRSGNGLSSGSKLHSSSVVSRRRNSDYDINNVVMPGNVMASYVEPARHFFIETPQWRMINDRADAEEGSSGEEDTDNETYRVRHAKMEIKEREQRYAPSLNKTTPGGKGGFRIGGKGFSRTCGKGSLLRPEAVTGEHLHVTPRTGLGSVPKGKRRKRESQISHFMAKKFEFLMASFPEPFQGFVQNQAAIKTEDGDITDAVSGDTSAWPGISPMDFPEHAVSVDTSL